MVGRLKAALSQTHYTTDGHFRSISNYIVLKPLRTQFGYSAYFRSISNYIVLKIQMFKSSKYEHSKILEVYQIT